MRKPIFIISVFCFVLISCNSLVKNNITPCLCVESLMKHDAKIVDECDNYYKELSEVDKEKWNHDLELCNANQIVTDNEVGNDSGIENSYPEGLKEQIDKFNVLYNQESSISDSPQMFSEEQLNILKSKQAILNEATYILNQIESEPSNLKYLSDFNQYKSSVNLKLTGITMQIQALEEMKQQGNLQ